MSQFSSELISIEQLFLNNDGTDDKGKNFFIPIYQRDFVWDKTDIEKFITDIFNTMEDRTSPEYDDYFIGGIVLCRDSMLEGERQKTSLEVIDGQQRLTTLSIILAFLVQFLKFRLKNFGSKEDYVKTTYEHIFNLIKYKKKNNITHEVIDMFKVERSDDIADIYQMTINNLITEEVDDFSFLTKEIKNEKNSLIQKQKKDFLKLIEYVHTIFSNYNENQLVGFSVQVLEYTRVVVTKTKDIQTGFLVFEKLNDNGKRLNPDDLLKNYLFSKASREEYQKLDDDWKIFLTQIHNINNKGTKVTPREFLENYLIINGKKVIGDKNKIFKIFKKEIYEKKEYTSLDLLDELTITVREYSALKRDNVILKYLNILGFKLGYLLFLSLHKKLPNLSYKMNRYNILINIFRLGVYYIITDNSKLLSKKIPEICKGVELYEQTDPEMILKNFNTLIQSNLKLIQEEFKDAITNSNLFDRRKNLTIELFNIINYSKGKKKYSETNVNLVQVIPLPKKLDNSNLPKIKNIDAFNISKSLKLIGNLTLVYKDSTIDQNSIEIRLTQLNELNILENNLMIDSKEDIEKRSNEFFNVLQDIFFHNNLEVDYFIEDNDL